MSECCATIVGMSRRSDRAAERRALEQAEKDLKQAGTAARKAFDLKDPRFLGEAAVAATRGPVGLALFGASRGLQVMKERRAEQAELLNELAADAKQHADTLREKSSVLAAPPQKKSPLRRFAPLMIIGLAGGAAVAGATAYLLRDPGAPSPAPAPPSGPAQSPAAGSANPGPAAGSAPQPSEDTSGGEDVTIDAPDPEGPADQQADPSPAAGSAKPGPAAGSAPQPTGDE